MGIIKGIFCFLSSFWVSFAGMVYEGMQCEQTVSDQGLSLVREAKFRFMSGEELQDRIIKHLEDMGCNVEMKKHDNYTDMTIKSIFDVQRKVRGKFEISEKDLEGEWKVKEITSKESSLFILHLFKNSDTEYNLVFIDRLVLLEKQLREIIDKSTCSNQTEFIYPIPVFMGDDDDIFQPDYYEITSDKPCVNKEMLYEIILKDNQFLDNLEHLKKNEPFPNISRNRVSDLLEIIPFDGHHTGLRDLFSKVVSQIIWSEFEIYVKDKNNQPLRIEEVKFDSDPVLTSTFYASIALGANLDFERTYNKIIIKRDLRKPGKANFTLYFPEDNISKVGCPKRRPFGNVHTLPVKYEDGPYRLEVVLDHSYLLGILMVASRIVFDRKTKVICLFAALGMNMLMPDISKYSPVDAALSYLWQQVYYLIG